MVKLFQWIMVDCLCFGESMITGHRLSSGKVVLPVYPSLCPLLCGCACFLPHTPFAYLCTDQEQVESCLLVSLH